ncbi:MAG: TolB family protein [Bacillota bacterium]
MQLSKGITAVLIAGLVVFAGCSSKEDIKPPAQNGTPAQQGKDSVKRPENRYVAEIDVVKAGVNLSGYNRDLMISTAGDKAVFSGFIPAAVKNSYMGVLMLADLKTGKVETIVDRTEYVKALAWTPDGKKVAYLYGEYGYDSKGKAAGREVVVAGADGKNTRILTQGPVDYNTPVWTPDGKAVVFVETAPDPRKENVFKLKITPVE